MVESPTYYHAMSPILRSLKKFDMETFPLQTEILYAKPAQKIPSYLEDATLQTAIVCIPVNTNLADEIEKDKPQATEELSNNAKTNVLDFQEEKAMDTPLFPASNLSPWITDAPMTTIRKLSLEEKIKPKPVGNEVYEENKHSDDCAAIQHFNGAIEANKVDCAILNNICEDQMDIDPILEKSLHSLSSSKTELCPGTDESTKMDTLLTNPSVAKTLRNVQNPRSKEKLGERMNVSRFLENIRNPTSKSFLEESQCEALVHALESRLAVIQGK